MSNGKDQLFAHPMGEVADFTFDSAVAAVFPDMIRRSVPGYATVISMTGLLAEHYAQTGKYCYDLGCSLGEGSIAMASRLQAVGLSAQQVIAIDNSEAMISRLQDLIKGLPKPLAIDPVCADIREHIIEDAALVALNYTLQFIPIVERLTLLKTIAEGMNPGAALILSEKIVFDDSAVNQLFVGLHHDFKRANGYSELEISQKRDAIDNVLLPESLSVHRQRLLEAGFSRVEVWFQCFNFASLLAFK